MRDGEIIDFIAEEYYAKNLRAKFPKAKVKYIRNNIFDCLSSRHGRRIALVMTASGLSRRFDYHKNKLLYKINGKEILRYGIDNLIDAKRLLDKFCIVSEIFAVTADDKVSGLVRRIYSDSVNIISSTDYAEGIAGSVRAEARAAAAGNFDAVLFLAGDMPNFAGGDILRLVLEFLCSGEICSGCAYSDHSSNPGIFLRECYEDLLKLFGDMGAMCLIKSAPEGTHFYAVSP